MRVSPTLCDAEGNEKPGNNHSKPDASPWALTASMRGLFSLCPKCEETNAQLRTMPTRISRCGALIWFLSFQLSLISAQQQCYYGPGAQYRGSSELVPCNGTGVSACCLLGDTCLSGSTCYNHGTGNLYQYGCTDINYQDPSCPHKCGFDANRSPWTALEYCDDIQDLSNTWICHGPESCGCEWDKSDKLLVLQRRGCKDMGADAYVALYAPSTLAPYVSLPSSIGGSTGYYSPTVSDGSSGWIETAVAGYTPSPFTQLTSYRAAPTTAVQIDPSAIPGPSTYAPAASYTAPATRSTNAIDNGSSSTVSATASLATASGQVASGLSTGAKAGIGVGISGGVCLLAAFGICFFLAHRRKRTNTAQTAVAAPVQHLYPGSPYSHMQAAPPYPYNSPPTQGSNWSGHPTPGTVPDPYHQRDIASPHSSISRDKPQMRPSFSSAGPDASPPTELAGEAVPPLHEIGTDDDRQSGRT